MGRQRQSARQRKRQYMQEFQMMRPEEKAQQVSLALLLLHRLIGRQPPPPAKQQGRDGRARRL